MAQTCMVRLLGRFAVEVDGRPVASDRWRHRRGADLVKILALAPRHRLHRDEVMDQLWPELGPGAAATNLRKAVHYARRALGSSESIAADGDLMVLWPSAHVSVDVDSIDAATSAVDVDLLPEDRYVDWTAPHRERLRNRRLEVWRGAGRWDQVLELDPTDEDACRRLMRALIESGNRQAAIRRFQQLREVLRVDMGLAPEPATIALFEEAVAMQGTQSPVAPERVQARLARGLMHWHEGNLDAAETLAEEARSLAAEHQLGRELGEASTLLGMVAMARGRWPDLFRQEFAAALQLGPDQAPFVIDAHLCLAEALVAGGSSESVGALARELLPSAIDSRSVQGEALMTMLIGETEFFSGRLDESNEWLMRAAELYEESDSTSGRAFTTLRLAEMALLRERPREASRHLTTARQLTERSSLGSHLRPRVLEVTIKASVGPERPQRVISEAASLVKHPKDVCGPCSIGLRITAVAACARHGDVALAAHWLKDAERLAEMWSGGPWQAAVWEARAALRLAQGANAQAAALLREAADLFASCGRPLDANRCVLAAAAP